ncbi:hypothetical protein G6F24_018964 [Rhizopus arrhizus]|nr:hypothetical protein G6F24_018964 [Rhizopus arrhizus]
MGQQATTHAGRAEHRATDADANQQGQGRPRLPLPGGRLRTDQHHREMAVLVLQATRRHLEGQQQLSCSRASQPPSQK